MRNVFAAGAVVSVALAACSESNAPPAPTGSTPFTTTAPPITTSSAAPTSRIIRETRFEDANGYRTEGTARIVQEGAAFTLELGDDFRTSQSPALDVRLCTEPNCRGGPELALGELAAFSGEQTYPLPDDGGRYSHAVIYCRAVRLAFGFGVLR